MNHILHLTNADVSKHSKPKHKTKRAWMCINFRKLNLILMFSCLFTGKSSPVYYIMPSLATIFYTYHAIVADRDLGFCEMSSNKLILHCEGVNILEKKKLFDMSLKRGWFMRLRLIVSCKYSEPKTHTTLFLFLAYSRATLVRWQWHYKILPLVSSHILI